MVSQVARAKSIAATAHSGQREESTGDPYLDHVSRVVEMVEGDDAKATAWLHDVLEDNTAWTKDRLLAHGIAPNIVLSVLLLTRTAPYDYVSYIERLRLSKDSVAIAVKVADLRDHLRPNCPARLRPRYEAALQALAG